MIRSLIFLPLFSPTFRMQARADDAARLKEYFSYFEGTWQITTLNGSETGSITIKRGEGGACHVLDYRFGNDRRTELWGYDPTTKHWMAIGFNQNGERFSQVMMDVPERATAEAGDRFWDKHEGVLPTDEKTSARLDFYIESQIAYTVKVTNITVGESKQEDASFRITRRGEFSGSALRCGL
jgi:hypothetical protein